MSASLLLLRVLLVVVGCLWSAFDGPVTTQTARRRPELTLGVELSPLGAGPAGAGTAISARSTVVRETRTPSRDNTAAPARLARTTGRAAINAVNCPVRRAHRPAIAGTCSRNVRRAQPPV